MKKRTPFLFNIWVVFTIVVMVELLVTIAAASIITWLLGMLPSPVQLPLPVWLVILCVTIGGATATYVNRKIFAPIIRLSQAMSRVAGGDFDTSLETSSPVNEVREIYRSFNLMAKELRATEILQTDFVSNVSHEFKTPINAIEGYATLLQNEDLAPEERREYVDRIILNTNRLSELVSNILLLSKIDNQTIQSEGKCFRLDEQIRRAIVLLEPKWSEKNIEFDVELEDMDFTGSESLLFHVWTNLIDNAVKFDPYGGYVGIKMERHGQMITVMVSDSGPGIPPEAQTHIFDKFFQSDGSHKDEGNGLGLALVKQILELSGGSVSVDNLPSGGCRFTVLLPMPVPHTGI